MSRLRWQRQCRHADQLIPVPSRQTGTDAHPDAKMQPHLLNVQRFGKSAEQRLRQPIYGAVIVSTLGQDHPLSGRPPGLIQTAAAVIAGAGPGRLPADLPP